MHPGLVAKGERRGYPSDVTDEEWALVAPYLALCKEAARQRDYLLRDVFNALRYVVRTGCQWRYLPNDLPPWEVVYQQAQRWIRARCFESLEEVAAIGERIIREHLEGFLKLVEAIGDRYLALKNDTSSGTGEHLLLTGQELRDLSRIDVSPLF